MPFRVMRNGFSFECPVFFWGFDEFGCRAGFSQHIPNTRCIIITCAAEKLGSWLRIKKSERTRKPPCVIQRGNVKVPVYKRTKKNYTEY